jgi:two-component system response regulator HydG
MAQRKTAYCPDDRQGEYDEAYYQDILDGINIGYTEFDLDGNITFFNNRVETMSSRSREELIGMHYTQYMDENAAKEAYRVFHEVYLTGIPKNKYIKELVRKDGKRVVTEGCVSLLRDAEGKPVGFREIWIDITDWKRTEEELADSRLRLEAIFRSVGDGIIAVDRHGVVIDANEAAEKICGLNIKETIGRSFTYFTGRCGKACHQVIAETLGKKTLITEHRIACGRRDRPQQTVVVTSSPLLDSQQEQFMGAVLVIRDMTKLVGLENELKRKHQFHNIVGRSKRMQEIYGFIDALANMDTTVLITGKSGTGKELVARALHNSGSRALKPFVTVNCSALAETLLESELFGHVKGAFTGAIRDKQGRFQMADGGTILLDEIGDISPQIQLKLLRVLQEKEFEPVGDSVPQRVDVRVIACTNKDLKEKVDRGEFREDMYYRLKVVEIALPSLQERLEDLPYLVEHFRLLFNERFKKNITSVSGEVMAKLLEYPWPGNIRELEHVIEHAFVVCTGREITMEHVSAEIKNFRKPQGETPPNTMGEKPDHARKIIDALEKARWNKTEAARLLGINRRTLYRQLQKFNLLP